MVLHQVAYNYIIILKMLFFNIMQRKTHKRRASSNKAARGRRSMNLRGGACPSGMPPRACATYEATQ